MYHYTPLVRGERSALYDTEDVNITTNSGISYENKSGCNASASIDSSAFLLR